MVGQLFATRNIAFPPQVDFVASHDRSTATLYALLSSISYVLMSSHSDVSWLTVIKHRQEDISLLTQDGFQFPEAPFEQQAFRKSFERLCKSKRIDSAARLQLHHYLFDSYTYIIDLAQEAIECATSLQDLNAPESLESLICRLAFAALQVSNPP